MLGFVTENKEKLKITHIDANGTVVYGTALTAAY